MSVKAARKRRRYSCPFCSDALYLGRGGVWYDDNGHRKQTNDIEDDPWCDLSETGQVHHGCLYDFTEYMKGLGLRGTDEPCAVARAALLSWWRI